MRLLQISLCAVLVFAIVAHGAVEDWARAVLETSAGLLFLFWAVRAYLTHEECVFISPLLPPLLALIFLALAQFLFRGTASPYDTRIDLQLLIALTLLLFLATQAFRGFAELVIPVALVPLVLGKVRRERWFAVGLLALFPLGALFLSASRGGIISLAAGLGLLTLLLVLRRTFGKHVLAGAVVLLFAFMLVSWLGVRQIIERFSSMQSLEVTSGKRASMRLDTWHIFREHPWTGTGLGTLQTVFPPYETLYDAKVVNHAHNDYLEALAETGIAGAACCAWFLGALFFRSLRRVLLQDKSFSAALHLSGLVGCTGFLVHGLVDFNLHIPGNALFFFLMANLATADILSPATPAPLAATMPTHPKITH